MKRLNLCKGHKQEENQSHFAEHNCKLLKQQEEKQVHYEYHEYSQDGEVILCDGQMLTSEEILTKLRAFEDIRATLHGAPELNTNNYDHDQVCQLNTAMCEAWSLVHN